MYFVFHFGVRHFLFSIHHSQKYPAFLRSSIAASERLSSARVPLSVTLDADISSITSSIFDAVDNTAPVQLISPMVRKRTIIFSYFSVSLSLRNSDFASNCPSLLIHSRW